jgi:hypothetical protein
VVIHLYNAWLNQRLDSPIISRELELAIVDTLVAAIERTTAELASHALEGSVLGFDKEIDALVFGDSCQVVEEATDLYNCSFTTPLPNLLRGLIREVTRLLPTSNAMIDNIPLSHIYHLVMTHLYEQDARIEDRLAQLMEIKVRN